MKLQELIRLGWKETDINKDEFKVLKRGDYSLIYSTKLQRIIIKYYNNKNGTRIGASGINNE